MEVKAEVKRFTVKVEKPDPHAVSAYTATSSSAKLNITLIVPAGTENAKGLPASSAVAVKP